MVTKLYDPFMKKGSMSDTTERLSTGAKGLDEILLGGLVRGGAYLVRGGPGTGKTTLGLHFLAAGAAAGEKVLCVALGEPVERITKNARSIGVSTDQISFVDLSPTSDFFAEVETYDIFSPAEVEREPTTRRIVEAVEKVQPARVFIDSMAQFRYLASDVFQYRKQVLSFLRFLTGAGATVLFTSESSDDMPDADVQFLSDGIIHLSMNSYGRQVSISKLRGSSFVPGDHGLQLTDAGMDVLPRLRPRPGGGAIQKETLPSGIPGVDQMLRGGLERGTISALSGPSGVGKTTLGLQFMKEAAGRGEGSIVYTFEEEVDTVMLRAEAINIPTAEMIEQGTLSLIKIHPLQYTPDEFAHTVKRDVERLGARIVMIDSISGYKLSLHGSDLVRNLHALCKYLQSTGVTVILVIETASIVGDFKATDSNLSYLADNIIFLRYLEIHGELRKAIGVLKKRMSDFDKSLREYEITKFGLKVGEPLSDLRGVLSGTPTWDEKGWDGNAA